jgi:hypothetical protein
MRPVKLDFMHRIAFALCVATLMAVNPLLSYAHIVKIEIQNKTTLFHGQSFGSVGPYEQIQGVIEGEIDPLDPRNALITDIALAPRDSHGMVHYRTTFTLQKPIDMRKSDGVIFYEIVNRGNHGGTLNVGGNPGDGFLYKRGEVLLWSGWQGDIPISAIKNNMEGIDVPTAHLPGGGSVVGPVIKRVVVPAGGTFSIGSIPGREPVSLDTSKATLLSAVSETPSGVRSGEQIIPSSDWAFADCRSAPFPGIPDPNFVCLKTSVDGTRLYQLVYQAKDPLILGVGLAAVRDVVSFFRYAATDAAGTPNPVAGSIRGAIGYGVSQSGRFAKSFLNLGFNEDEHGKIVWDGLYTFIAGMLGSFNVRFGVPGEIAELYDPGSDGPLWWSDYEDSVRHRPTWGLLHRCTETRTCPRVAEVYGATEYWYSRGTAGIVGTSALADIPLPDNVRRYYIAGTPHGGGKGGFRWKTEEQPCGSQMGCMQVNPNPMIETSRALYVGLVEWVTKNRTPPDSAYPKLSDHTLVPATSQAMGWPNIPGMPSPDGVVNPVLDYDYGPRFRYNDDSGIIDNVPAPIKSVFPTLVPRVDSDGNEIAGIHTLLQRMPLGTYTGWYPIPAGPLKGREKQLAGGYIPFPRTKAERLQYRDPRPSIEERYPNFEQYISKARKQAEELVNERYLLPEDAARLMKRINGDLAAGEGGLSPHH